MKKLIALLLAFMMMLTLFACGTSSESVPEEPQTSVTELSVQEELTATPEPTSEPTPEETPEEAIDNEPVEEDLDGPWKVQQSVDEFGDEDGYKLLTTTVYGDFSNTATQSSKLTCVVFVGVDPKSNDYIVVFRLLEYGDTRATYYSSQTNDLSLKTKVNDEVEEYDLSGSAPNGDLVLRWGQGTEFVNSLYDGQDIRCIIYIGNSQYNFTVESGNFAAIGPSVFE